MMYMSVTAKTEFLCSCDVSVLFFLLFFKNLFANHFLNSGFGLFSNDTECRSMGKGRIFPFDFYMRFHHQKGRKGV